MGLALRDSLSGLFLSTHLSLFSRFFTRWQLPSSETRRIKVSGSLTGAELAQPHFHHLSFIRVSHQPARLRGGKRNSTFPCEGRGGPQAWEAIFPGSECLSLRSPGWVAGRGVHRLSRSAGTYTASLDRVSWDHLPNKPLKGNALSQGLLLGKLKLGTGDGKA